MKWNYENNDGSCNLTILFKKTAIALMESQGIILQKTTEEAVTYAEISSFKYEKGKYWRKVDIFRSNLPDIIGSWEEINID